MEPLKSVSGVLVAGPAGIHRFAPTYPFCAGVPGQARVAHEWRRCRRSVSWRTP